VEEYKEAVNRRRAGCGECIHQLGNSQPWECEEVTLPFISRGEVGGGARSCREVRWMLKVHSKVNSESWE
jgi:hypothetical protein